MESQTIETRRARACTGRQKLRFWVAQCFTASRKTLRARSFERALLRTCP